MSVNNIEKINELTSMFNRLTINDINIIKAIINEYNIITNKVIIIQSLVRKLIVIKKLRKKKDNFTLDIIKNKIKRYNYNYLEDEKINRILSKKKIRHQNYPSEITENIVKFVIFKKYKVMGCWDTKCGDLDLMNKKIEIKGFMSSGPCSFGPTEKWNWIYFVDCRKCVKEEFIVYELKLSNDSIKWRNLILSGKKNNNIKTMGMLCDKGKGGARPRLCFKEIKKQLINDIKIIWKGNINDL